MSVMNVHVKALISTALGLFVSNALAGDMAECSKLADKDKKLFAWPVMQPAVPTAT